MSEKNILYGLHSVNALLKNQPDRILRLLVLKERNDQKIQNIITLAQSHKIPLEFHARHALDQSTQDGNHQGVVAYCQPPKVYSESDLEDLLLSITPPFFFLILDGVQDPHNLGACLRSADAAGVHAVIVPKDKSATITQTVSKVASGAAETIPFIQVTNLARTMRFLKDQGVWLFGAAENAEKSLYKADFTGSLGIVMGREGDGLRRLTKEHCDGLFNIPMQGSVSSLNVSVATGVFLFEVVRQRHS